MTVNFLKDLPNGDAEFELELTGKERVMIKEFYGWKRLSQKRINFWLTEVLENYMDMKCA